jgi:hypothetical protein
MDWLMSIVKVPKKKVNSETHKNTKNTYCALNSDVYQVNAYISLSIVHVFTAHTLYTPSMF